MLLTQENNHRIWQNIPMRSIYRHSSYFGQSFHWLETGWQHQETIVLLHGYMAHSMAFRRVAQTLATHYRVIIPDLPGHGRDLTFHSQQLTPDIASLQRWLYELIATINQPRIHLVGHSLGALLTFITAKSLATQPPTHPLVRTVTLVSPGVQLSAPRWSANILRRIPASVVRLGLSHTGMRLYEPIQWRQARMTRAEMASYLEPIRDVQRLEFILNLGADLLTEPDRLVGAELIDHPTLVIWGKKDHLMPLSTAYLLQDKIHNAILTIFDNCGHCPMEDCPSDFAHTLQSFLGNQ